MAEDRLQRVREHWSVLWEITKHKHGIRQIPIRQAMELRDDLEWCVAEITALRERVERLPSGRR